MPSERLVATVRGRVQGVGYRIYIREWANRLGIRGTVRNCPDGTVEVIAEARPVALDRLEVALHTGSPAARVEEVTIRREPSRGKFRKFDLA
ncbi:MAG TPA: acylphosphatase [Bacteroidetes bacterium]|nr:acylphosphatase [Bacteroidota bacterium]HIL56945.1 acylphosphatase [Rhodothermales bacterium]